MIVPRILGLLGFLVRPPPPLQPELVRLERMFAHSLRLVLPRITATASRRRVTRGASCLGAGASIRDSGAFAQGLYERGNLHPLNREGGLAGAGGKGHGQRKERGAVHERQCTAGPKPKTLRRCNEDRAGTLAARG